MVGVEDPLELRFEAASLLVEGERLDGEYMDMVCLDSCLDGQVRIHRLCRNDDVWDRAKVQQCFPVLGSEFPNHQAFEVVLLGVLSLKFAAGLCLAARSG